MHKRAGIGWLMLFLLLGCGRKNEQIGAGENGAIPEKPAGFCFRQVGLITLETIVPVNRIKMAYGKFFVSDRKNRMYAFQLDGQLLATFCCSGEGPGELQYLEDFLISREQVVVADLARKLLFYNHFGRFIREIKLENNAREQIHGLLSVDGELCCVTRSLIQRESQNQADYHFRVYRLSDRKILCSLLDDTVQLNPESKVRIPYLVQPYPNRKLFVQLETGEALILAVREKEFHLWKDGRFVPVPFFFELEAELVDKADRLDFYRQMKQVNSAKTARDIKRFVEFPESKEYFMGAIPWDGWLALLKMDRILIVDLNGCLVRELAWPKEIGGWSYWDFFYPERRIQFHGKRLYYLNEEKESLQVFELTGTPNRHSDFGS